MFDFLYNPTLPYVILRVALGALLVAHGFPKFKNFSAVSGWFDSIGLKPGKFWLAIAASVEFFGGILLILGIWVWFVGLLVAIQMVVAMAKVKWGKIGLTAPGGWELDMIYLAVAVAVALMSRGIYTTF